MNTGQKNKRGSILLLAVCFLVVIIGTVALAQTAKSFSHQLHLSEDIGAQCSDCHGSGAKTELAPTEERCGQCHESAMLPLLAKSSSARPLRLEFSHELHAQSFSCEECHKGVNEDLPPVSGMPTMNFSDCSACHRENGIEVDEKNCTACHGKDRRKLKPEDHKASWLARHGVESQWRVFDDHGQQCTLCHRSQACVACHRQRKPADHNGLWRMRLHGRQADWDRERCKTCHESGTCIRCHKDTKPSNHIGSWRYLHGKAAPSGLSANCRVCHQPGYCASCHATGGK